MSAKILNASRVLILDPHTDAVEVGCGASCHRCITKGGDVKIANLSDALNIFDSEPSHTMFGEALGAAWWLEVGEYIWYLGILTLRSFSQHREQMLDFLCDLGHKMSRARIVNRYRKSNLAKAPQRLSSLGFPSSSNFLGPGPQTNS